MMRLLSGILASIGFTGFCMMVSPEMPPPYTLVGITMFGFAVGVGMTWLGQQSSAGSSES